METTNKIKIIAIRFKWLLFIVGFPVIGLIAHSLVIVTDGLNNELEKADIALVLGNEVYKDGSLSPRLQSRVDKAIQLFNDDYFDYIIVSGGIGKSGHDEAKAMKAYLMQHDIPEDVIIVDSEGINTYKSAVNTARILKNKKLKSVMVISNYYHISRSKLALKQEGIKPIHSAHADHFEIRDLYAIFREYPAYYVYMAKY